MRDLQPLALDDFAAAPFQLSVVVELAAEPAAVFAELGDPSLWFPMMRRSVWRTGATSGVAAEREVDMRMFGRFRERMLVWQPGERLAFTMTATSSPLVARMAEDWRLTASPTGTTLAWTVAATPTTAGRALMPALRVILRGLFTRGAKELARRAAAYPRAERVSSREVKKSS